MKDRKAWSEETKIRQARRILIGESTIAATSKELDAQSYQVAAWVGLEAERQVQAGYRLTNKVMPEETSAISTDEESPTKDMSNEDRVILSLLTKKFLRRLSP